MLGAKIVIEKWRFYRQETRDKTESPEWNRWNSFKEGHVQNRKPNEVALTTVSKLSLEQVHEKQSLETPEMAKKKLYSRPGPYAKQRSACLKFVKKNKNLTVEKGWNDHLFLDQCPKYIVSAA